MIAGSILYLYAAGLDMGTAAEQLLNGMYSSFLLLAIPLFVLAAEFMNAGSIMDRLLRFCNAIVGRFRGGLAHVNVVQSIIFASMSGSALADAASSGKLMQSLMTRDGKYPPAYAAALTTVSSVIGPIMPPSIPLVLYALVSDTSVGYLFLGGVVPGLLIGACAERADRLHREAAQLPRRSAGAAAGPSARHLGGVSGADDAGDPARLPVQRHHDAHGGRRGGRRVCAADLRLALPQHQRRRTSTSRCEPARASPCRSAC